MSLKAYENPELWSALAAGEAQASSPNGSCSSHCHGAEQQQAQVHFSEQDFAEVLTPA